jgi:uncharacterized lipoprotein NlpE involved in copper resistance
MVFRKYFYFFIFLFVSCNSSDDQVKNAVNKEVVIEYVDLSIQTIARVSCDSYSTLFKRHIKRIVIAEHEKNYREIYRLADSLKSYDKQGLDIRVKIIFNNKNPTSICMDAFGNFTFSGSDSSFRNTDLHELIADLIE